LSIGLYKIYNRKRNMAKIYNEYEEVKKILIKH